MATAMSATLNAVLLYKGLHQLGVYKVSRTTVFWVIKLIASTLVMSAALYWASLNWPLEIAGFTGKIVQLFGLIFFAMVVYFAAFTALGFRLRQLRSNF